LGLGFGLVFYNTIEAKKRPPACVFILSLAIISKEKTPPQNAKKRLFF